MSIAEEIKDYLSSRAFYEVMQSYRHAPIGSLQTTLDSFELVKTSILEQINIAQTNNPLPEPIRAIVDALLVEDPTVCESVLRSGSYQSLLTWAKDTGHSSVRDAG